MSKEDRERLADVERRQALKELEEALVALSAKPNLALRDRAIALQAIEKIRSEQYESAN
jgi:hypothetical protein